MLNAKVLLILFLIIILIILSYYIREENDIKEPFKTAMYPKQFELELTDAPFFVYNHNGKQIEYKLEYLKLEDYNLAISKVDSHNKYALEIKNFKLDIEQPYKLNVFINEEHVKGHKYIQFNVLSNGVLHYRMNIDPELPLSNKKGITIIYQYTNDLPNILSRKCHFLPKNEKTPYECVKNCIMGKEFCSGIDCLWKCNKNCNNTNCPWLNVKNKKSKCNNHIPSGSTKEECLNNCKNSTECSDIVCEADCDTCSTITPNICTWNNKCSKYLLNNNKSLLDNNYNNIVTLLRDKQLKNEKFFKNL